MYNDLAYAPFGEQYAQAGTVGVTSTSFAGNNEDTATNLYDAQFREYEPFGRWPSPDPAGVTAANPANPQSWNRYAYAVNNPLLFLDPSGLDPAGAPCTGNGKIDHHHGTVCVCAGSGCFFYPINLYIGAGASNSGAPPFEPAIFNPVLNPQPFPTLSNNQPSGSAPGSPQKQSYANCVKNSGNEASVQGLLGLDNSKLAGAFLGNPISDLINAFTGNGSAAAGAGDAVSAAAPNGLRQVPNVAVSYTSTTITASPSEFSIITNKISAYLPLGEIASGAAGVLEGFTKLVQAPVDITASAFGAVVCAAGP